MRIIVARPVEPTSPDYQALASHAPIIPTKLLTDPEELDRTLLQTAGYTNHTFLQSPNEELAVCHEEMLPTHIEVVAVNNAVNLDNNNLALISPSSINLPLNQQILSQYLDTPETETYDVELRKNVYGLGITVAGYVCEEEELSGIFVKSIIEGSAAEVSGKIQINDRIVAVDGRSLSGVCNYQAVEILRNTDIIVNLTLERFLRGRKYEHLQVALVDGKAEGASQKSLPQSPSVTTLSLCQAKSDADSITTECGECGEIEGDMESCGTAESNSVVENGNEAENEDDGQDEQDDGKIIQNHVGYRSDYTDSRETLLDEKTPIQTPSIEVMTVEWTKEVDTQSTIVVTEINKLSGLGISIEGTVEVECGIEMRPHHYIRSILNEGPVGKDGKLMIGDELLQINEHKLQGLRHTDVVKIIKTLPENVKIVAARGSAPTVINTSNNPEAFEARSILTHGLQSLCLQGMLTKAQSESSLYTSSTATITDQQRSKSLEQVSGLALWTDEVTFVEIEKTERGFGFSILDYQDPIDTEGTVIVVRGLIPGGSAEASCLIFPGDRIISVNNEDLQNVTLDHAVNVLKGIPPGVARIGLCRPLSNSDNNLSSASTPTT